jgi:hypothetical protein
MNNPDHITQSLESICWMRIKDPGWKKFGSGIKHPGPATLHTVPVLRTYRLGENGDMSLPLAAFRLLLTGGGQARQFQTAVYGRR